MADIKWIKISTDLFDNRKIKQIECLPDGDAIIVIWFKILCLAGTINDGGQVYFTHEIPYTEQMLSTQFNRPLATVQMALNVFEQFGMIDVIEDVLHVSNWERYQNIEGMEKVREQTRQRNIAYRERKRAAQIAYDVTVTSRDATDIDKNKNKNIEEIVEERETRHKYGLYKNVLLSDSDHAKLVEEYPYDYDDRIARLSEYIASTGKRYKNHLATIRAWARKDAANDNKTEDALAQWLASKEFDDDKG